MTLYLQMQSCSRSRYLTCRTYMKQAIACCQAVHQGVHVSWHKLAHLALLGAHVLTLPQHRTSTVLMFSALFLCAAASKQFFSFHSSLPFFCHCNLAQNEPPCPCMFP